MADFVGDGEAQAVFEARTHEGALVHEDGFKLPMSRASMSSCSRRPFTGTRSRWRSNSARSRTFTGSSRPAGCAARNRSASCQIRSLGLYGALKLRGSFKVG